MKSIGRSAETKVTAATWDDLWKLDGPRMRHAGIPVKDRRCVCFVLVNFMAPLNVQIPHKVYFVVYGEIPLRSGSHDLCSPAEAEKEDTRVSSLHCVSCVISNLLLDGDLLFNSESGYAPVDTNSVR